MNFFKRYPYYKFILAFLDFSSLAAAFFLALKVRFWPSIDLINNPNYFIHPLYWTLLGYAVFCVFIFQYYNLYKKNVFITIVQHQILILKAVGMSILGLIIISFLVRYPKYVIDSRLVILYGAVASLVLVSFMRIIVFRNLFLLFAKNSIIRRRAVIIGAGKSGKMVAASMLTDKQYGYELVGFVDDHVEVGKKVLQSYIVLGGIDEINEIVNIYNVDEIIVCITNTTHNRLIEIIEKCKETPKTVQVYSGLYEIVAHKVEVERFSDFPLVRIGHFYDENLNHWIKRIIDIAGSLVGLILFSPFFLAISIAIKRDSPGPVLFKQIRLGKDGKPFQFYKFRSMYIDADDRIHKEYLRQLIKNGKAAKNGGEEGVFKIVNDPRVTKVGKFLRRTSLDEFPQLINVLKGDMSLVGPRPALPYEFEEYSSWHKRRVRVLPGLTGLWQVSGRSAVTFDDMVALDLYYIENMSPWFDIQIILKTIPVLFFKKTGL